MYEYSIRFRNGMLNELRETLLSDLDKEQFAALLGKTWDTPSGKIITVQEVVYPSHDDLESNSLVSVRIKKKFVAGLLEGIRNRIDVDTYIEVHTHPFAEDKVGFSVIDDADEKRFTQYLDKYWPAMNYTSIVFSKTMYNARYWDCNKRKDYEAEIKTQQVSEQIDRTGNPAIKQLDNTIADMFDRGILALGLDTMRKIMSGQKIAVVGVGGLGSVIAESLIHMGFQHLVLIDNDKLELSNLNRITGASFEDAVGNLYKVDVVARYLKSINPHCIVETHKLNILDKEAEYVLVKADWIIVGTDNHASRFKVQEYAFKYYIPFITAGVNISTSDNRIDDISGEVITVKIGDSFCLSCLNRVNYDAIAAESHPDKEVRAGLVTKGYVSGMDVKEPAVKTLNAIVGNLAVESLVNQFTERQSTEAILVYENNKSPTIYEDTESLVNRRLNCNVCG